MLNIFAEVSISTVDNISKHLGAVCMIPIKDTYWDEIIHQA